MAKVEFLMEPSSEDLSFLNDYPDNFRFLVDGTLAGNRESIIIFFTPDKELKEYGAGSMTRSTGFELCLGNVNVILHFKKRGNIKAKVDKKVELAPTMDRVARRLGYPLSGIFQGVWTVEKEKQLWEEVDKEKRRKQ